MKYLVTITAHVTKTIEVEKIQGMTKQDAVESAHENFSVLNDGIPEKYSEDTDYVEIVD